MSASPVTLDFSKAQPIAGGVTLDFSKAQPFVKTNNDKMGFETGLDETIPLSSYGNATMSGLQSVGRGLRDAVQGAGHMIAHPIDTLEGIAKIPSQAMQVPGAIHDINKNSTDPVGDYAKVAQETAGQGAGQALVAAGTEGIAKTIPKVIGKVGEVAQKVTPKQVAQTVGGTGGAIAGHGPLSIPGAYYGAKTGGKIAESILGDRANVPIMRTAPKPIYPGAPLPETPTAQITQARAIGQGAKLVPPSPAEALGKLPTPKQEPVIAKPNTSPKAVETQLTESLGGRPLQPGVKLRDQGKVPTPTSAPSDLKPVDSTAVKAYKYDPAKREFTATSANGATYIHGDVSPELAKAFEKATSKGKAWNDIRNNSPLVGKIVNGQRINHAPSIRSASPDSVAP